MIRPYVGRKANVASRLLCRVLVKLPVGISDTGTYRKFFLKLLEPCLPCLDDHLANLRAVWDVFVLNILTKEKKQIMKLWAFNNTDRLSRKRLVLCTFSLFNHTWSSATMKFIIWVRRVVRENVGRGWLFSASCEPLLPSVMVFVHIFGSWLGHFPWAHNCKLFVCMIVLEMIL